MFNIGQTLFDKTTGLPTLYAGVTDDYKGIFTDGINKIANPDVVPIATPNNEIHLGPAVKEWDLGGYYFGSIKDSVLKRDKKLIEAWLAGVNEDLKAGKLKIYKEPSNG